MRGSTQTIIVSLTAASALALLVDGHVNTYRPDPWITLKTKIALLTDIDVSVNRINVDTVDGHVTLHGEVGSAQEMKRAAEVAQRIEGAVDVRNLLHVVSDYGRDDIDLCDDEIRKAVTAALENDAALQRSHITVASVNNGTVLIAGTATSVVDHLRAIKTARGIVGVRRVASEVKNPPRLTDRDVCGAMMPDEDPWITTATKLRLLADDVTPALQINVDTDSGVVTLFGVVPTEGAKLAAEAETSKVRGVRSVVNVLQVVPDRAQDPVVASDDDVKKAVKSVLRGREDLRDIDVEVENGVARLTGRVPEPTDRLQASVVVRSARGVRSVENNIRVATE
jgi:osmotically-inducible protein OsmY